VDYKYSVINVSKGINHLKENDPIIHKIIQEIGDFPLKPNNEKLCNFFRIIIGQQLSVKVAQSIFSKLKGRIIGQMTPSVIIALEDQVLFESGLSANKIRAIKDLSNEITKGKLNLDIFPQYSNKEIYGQLIKIKGIGPWTIHNYLIFVLVRLNVLPISDTAFKRAIKLNYNLTSTPTEKMIIRISKKWGNYHTIASWYLWETINRGILSKKSTT